MKDNFKFVPYFIISLVIFGAVMVLIWADYETTNWADALAKENIINGFIFYALPALLLAFFVFSKIQKPLGNTVGIVVSLVLSIPISFVAIIFGLKIISIIFFK